MTAKKSLLTGKDLIPETCSEALARWDAGESVFTVEMGGLGPGYEQCIHVLVFELLRAECGNPVPDEKAYPKWGDATCHIVSKKLGGMSGAQVGAAKNLAYLAIRDGWRAMVESAPQDRHIQVGRTFPALT